MSFTAINKLSKAPLALSVFVLTLLLAVPAAFAHTHPTEMMPAADSTVSAPTNVMIHFSEALEPKFSMITLTDANGRVINKEPSVVSPDAKMMTLPLPKLNPGVYTVNWVGVAVDTHRSTGDYKFTVK
jgi:methionine-rich copper-binding protein CopC